MPVVVDSSCMSNPWRQSRALIRSVPDNTPRTAPAPRARPRPRRSPKTRRSAGQAAAPLADHGVHRPGRCQVEGGERGQIEQESYHLPAGCTARPEKSITRRPDRPCDQRIVGEHHDGRAVAAVERIHGSQHDRIHRCICPVCRVNCYWTFAQSGQVQSPVRSRNVPGHQIATAPVPFQPSHPAHRHNTRSPRNSARRDCDSLGAATPRPWRMFAN
jgi:hypothetical protein